MKVYITTVLCWVDPCLKVFIWFLCSKVLLHQACASSDRRAVNTQTSATFENTQYTRVFSRLGSGKQRKVSCAVSYFTSKLTLMGFPY